MKRNIFLTIIAIGIVLLSVSASKENDILEKLHFTPTKIAIPNITLPSVTDNTMVSLNDYRGSLVVLSIWRAGCHYCQLEAPMMSDLAKLAANNENIQVLGLSIDKNFDEAKSFIKKYNLMYPHMRDTNGKYLEQVGLGIRGTPTSYLIDPKGNLIGTSIGYYKAKGKTKYKLLKKLYTIYNQ